MWAKGASQILFSLSLGFGSQMNLSTYNNFKNNTQRDAVIISICNSLTSIYAGFVVFSILGFMKDQTGADNWDDVSILKTFWAPGYYLLITNSLLFSNY